MKAPSAPILNALSFDVEEYFHVHAFKDVISPGEWEQRESRVVSSTRLILRLLAEHDTQATFFVLGWVAKKHPALVREIADGGHEVASHGYAHQAVYELTSEEFARDLQRAGEAILSACPQAELKGYRAPSFSINKSTPWAYERLKDAGFRYDSSVSPATTHDRYGVKGASRFVHQAEFGVIEIPPSTLRLRGQNLPVAGGGHFRLAPLSFTKWAMHQIHREGKPVVSYFHPWEFDPRQPRIRNASWKSRFRHYTNVGRTESRLSLLLQAFRFDRMDQVFAEALSNSPANSDPQPREAVPSCS